MQEQGADLILRMGSFFISSGFTGLAFFFLGEMFQGKSLQNDENHGAL